MIPVRPFYMLRHGQSEANVANVIAGRGVDSPLTAQGRAEAETVRSTLSQLDIPPQVIVHSSLSRARDTAHILNKSLGLPTCLLYTSPADKGIYIPVTRNPATCTDTDGAPVDHCVCNTTPTYAETPTPCADPVCDQPDTGTETFVTSIPTLSLIHI